MSGSTRVSLFWPALSYTKSVLLVCWSACYGLDICKMKVLLIHPIFEQKKEKNQARFVRMGWPDISCFPLASPEIETQWGFWGVPNLMLPDRDAAIYKVELVSHECAASLIPALWPHYGMNKSTCCPHRLLQRLFICDGATCLQKSGGESLWALPVHFSLKVSKHSPKVALWVLSRRRRTVVTVLPGGSCRRLAAYWEDRMGLAGVLGLCRGAIPLSRCGQARPTVGHLSLPLHHLCFQVQDFPFKQRNWDKYFNSSIWCRGFFSLGWRGIVKCFPFLKNYLDFG